MSAATTGLHHVTAIAGDLRRTVDFYRGVLGLHSMKRMVSRRFWVSDF